jgi:tetratricopeptide (TPR) repeat protein
MRIFVVIGLLIGLVVPSLAAEENARPDIIDVLTARLALAASADEAIEIEDALRDVYAESSSPSAEVLFAQARVVAAEGDITSALYKLTRGLVMDEGQVAAVVLRGDMHLAAGQIDDAMDDALAAVELAPDYYDSLGLLARTFEAQGYYASAFATTREALRYNPQSAALAEQLERHRTLARGAGL